MSSNIVTSLKPDEVFVFGSNASGFHGAGAAAFAMFGKAGANWRTDYVPETNGLYLNEVPDGTKGAYAIKGVASGFQTGLFGSSYAIQTVTRPGFKRSVSLKEIKSQLSNLYNMASCKTDLVFLLTSIGSGFAGYSTVEIAGLYAELGLMPTNIKRI